MSNPINERKQRVQYQLSQLEGWEQEALLLQSRLTSGNMKRLTDKLTAISVLKEEIIAAFSQLGDSTIRATPELTTQDLRARYEALPQDDAGRSRFIETLRDFCRISSEDNAYDEALEPCRQEVDSMLATLAEGAPDNLEEDYAPYADVVNCLKGDESLLLGISESGKFSPVVCVGLATKKYSLKMEEEDKREDRNVNVQAQKDGTPSAPGLAEPPDEAGRSEPVGADVPAPEILPSEEIQTPIGKKAEPKISDETFKDEMEAISGKYTSVAILLIAGCLKVFTDGQMHRALVAIFDGYNKEKLTDTSKKLDALRANGYLTMKKLEQKWTFCLTSLAVDCLTRESLNGFIREKKLLNIPLPPRGRALTGPGNGALPPDAALLLKENDGLIASWEENLIRRSSPKNALAGSSVSKPNISNLTPNILNLTPNISKPKAPVSPVPSAEADMKISIKEAISGPEASQPPEKKPDQSKNSVLRSNGAQNRTPPVASSASRREDDGPEPYEIWDAENPPLRDAASRTTALGLLDVQTPDVSSMRALIAVLIEEASGTEINTSLPGSFARALVLAKSLTLKKGAEEEYKNLYTRLLLATDAPIDVRDYSASTLSTVYDGDDLQTPLYLASLLRAFFMPVTSDYGLYDMGNDTQAVDYIETYSSSLLSIFGALREMAPAGFSPSILGNLCSGADRVSQQNQLAEEARALQRVPSFYAAIARKEAFLSACFGKNSDLGKSMSTIAEKDTKGFEFVKTTHEALQRKIEGFIDETWKNHVSGKGRLDGSPRKNVQNNIQKRLDVMRRWIDLNDSVQAKIPEEDLARFVTLKARLLRLIPQAISEMTDRPGLPELKDRGPIVYMLRRVEYALKNGFLPDDAFAFADMLRSCHVELDTNGVPLLGRFENVKGFESWRNALRHIAETPQTLRDVMGRINSPEDRYYFDNIGAATLTGRLGAAPGTPGSYAARAEDLSNARKLAQDDQKRFRADFELAFAYGCIEEAAKELILKMEDQYFEALWENQNFGHYRLFLDTLKKQLKNESSQIRKKLEERFESLPEALKADLLKEDQKGQPRSLVREIRRKIESEDYTVAEDYLNRVAAGYGTELPAEEVSVSQEVDFFQGFLDIYEELQKECLRYKDREEAISVWGFQIVDRWGMKGTSQQRGKRNIENARALLEGWPRSKKLIIESGGAPLVRLFTNLGFEVNEGRQAEYLRECDDRRFGNRVVFSLNVNRAPKNLSDYTHPIALFGTQAPPLLHIVCLFGTLTPSQIMDNIDRLNLGPNTIVLLDSSAMTLQQRRELADLFRRPSHTQQNSFLLIDQILLLYLAMQDRSDRLPVLLKCTLPYTYYQPFVKGAGEVDDEMFFGRKTELRGILEPGGAILVYGGRQLGKSVLMSRAESQANRPENEEYAIRVGAWHMNVDETLAKVLKVMQKKGIVDDGEYTTWGDLCSALSAAFDDGRIRKLLFLIDEADVFLSEDQKQGFKVLDMLGELKSELKNRFGDCFKYVFAGLHQVARASAARNGLSPRFPSLCVRPLSPSDARNLLMRPLHYLGFRMDSGKLDSILAHTNYYPGILQLLGYTLVDKLSEEYANYYSANR
ncbi:MAG: hypothetical protein LBQ90_11200, partial [Synergistaceae bacterium]|nr:hypothetical protein [Synergistaceae bacterium]